MNLIGGNPFWAVRNGLLATYPPLREDTSCEMAIVGGGITGALAAYHLAEAGVATTLLDKRAIGSGSTAGSTGLLQYEIDVPLRDLIAKIGKRNAERSYVLCQEAVEKIHGLVRKHRIGCECERRPSLFLARNSREIDAFKEKQKLRKAIGLDVQFWERTQIEKHFPFRRPAALFSEDAAQIDPHRFTHGLLIAAMANGLRVCDRTSVKKLVPTRSGIEIITDTGLKVRSRKVLVAAGFEAKSFISGFGALKSTFAFISEPVANLREWFQKSLIWESGSPFRA